MLATDVRQLPAVRTRALEPGALRRARARALFLCIAVAFVMVRPWRPR